MSNSALSWAFSAKVDRSTDKFVLVALANYSDDMGISYPSQARLVADTTLDRKTVISAIARLQDAGLIVDTEYRKGGTNQVIVYRLVGISAPVRHYVYKMTEAETGRFYIGKRSFDGDPKADTYQGSGAWVKQAQAKRAMLVKSILAEFDSATEALKFEWAAIKSVDADPLCMNGDTLAKKRKLCGFGMKSTENGQVRVTEIVPYFPPNGPVFPMEESRISREQSRKRDTEPLEPSKEPSMNHQRVRESAQIATLFGEPVGKPPALVNGKIAAFEDWWRQYPRKVGKGAAAQAYAKALKIATAEQLLASLNRQWPDRIQYIPHPTTFLNQQRWLDEVEEEQRMPSLADLDRYHEQERRTINGD